MRGYLDNFCNKNNKKSSLIIVTLWFVVSLLLSLHSTPAQESTYTSSQRLLCSEASIEPVFSEIHLGETESDSNAHICYGKGLNKLKDLSLVTRFSRENNRLTKWLKPLPQAPPYYSLPSFTV